MSDRGELYVHYAAEHEGATGYWRPAEPTDLLAAVRVAVEDGTIEGAGVIEPLEDGLYKLGAGTYLLIPVSDGGSET
jgi:hypothetical protein